MRQKDGKLKLNKQDKPVVLVLGTGWGAHSLSKVRSRQGCTVGRKGSTDIGALKRPQFANEPQMGGLSLTWPHTHL